MNKATKAMAWFLIALGTVFSAHLPGEQATGELTEAAATAASSAWQVTTGSMAAQRTSATVTLLPSGKVLVAGGDVVMAELFDPGAGVFETTAEMEQNRHLHTATLLPSSEVLLVGGHGSAGNSLDTAELYDPATEQFSVLPNLLNQPREYHTATLLPSIGKVLVVGGIDAVGAIQTALQSAEIFDPQAGSWSTTAPPLIDRWGHTASLLPTGEVMVVGGGRDDGSTTVLVELYDPVLESWSELNPLAIDRRNHTATVLSDGRLLVAGGIRDAAPDVVLNSVEIYDPITGQWTGPAAMSEPRFNHAAVLLPSGKLLVMGGQDQSGADLASAELYDPGLGTWQTVDPMTIARRDHDATLLPSGEVLVVGGRNRTRAEIYRPGGAFWHGTAGTLEGSRYYHTATLLTDGKLLVAGGSSGETTEIYDPATGNTTNGELLEASRTRHTATLLTSGEVLLVGGDSSLTDVELYDPSTVPHTTTPVASLPTGRYNHTATLLPSGGVLVVGGVNDDGEVAAAEIFLPDQTWASAGSLATARSLHTATLLPSGKVLVAGGSLAGGGATATAELYDPTDDVWSHTGSMSSARSAHTATLLPSGKVLVAGGSGNARAELYDPETGTWSATDSLTSSRKWHAATLLPSGRVLITGGESVGRASFTAAEIYDPATDTWSDAGSMLIARRYHTSTLLPTGEVVIVGGFGGSSSSELYHPRFFLDTWRPQLTSVSVIQYGDPVATVSGLGFCGGSEASHGQTGNSAVNSPLVRVMPIENPQIFYLSPDAVPNGINGAMTLDFSRLPPGLTPGWYLLFVDVAGVPSEAILADVHCGFEILDPDQPADVTDAPLGEQATFSIDSESGRSFTWYRDGLEILGATGPTYVMPMVVASDSGSTYQVRVDSGCRQYLSRIATLTVHDTESPTVDVMAPDGGEYWKLSDAEETFNEVISWSMSDNIRICQVEVLLLYSNDGGVTYLPAPATGDPSEPGVLPKTFGPGGTCPHPGESTTNMVFNVPTSPPSGMTNSLYKIEVRVTDHAGRTTTAQSDLPFFMITRDPSVRTLILANPSRMVSEMGITTAEAVQLVAHLHDLAGHRSVQGFVGDLGTDSGLADLYAVWDADSESPEPDPDFANLVLFGCHGDPRPAGCPGEKDGIHDVIHKKLLDAYPDVAYLILIGDDRIIPMARLRDRTHGFLESNYTSDDPLDPNAGLTPGGTTVGQALAADRYLSDDPLAMLSAVDPADLRQGEHLFLPDLAVGRLVEDPAEIITAIATFISQDGVLDLTALDQAPDHKVLITGYDFLRDSAKKNRRWWKNAFDLPEPHDDDALAPVDGQLIGQTWDETALRTHLSGHDLVRYGVMNLNGHATHYEEGVPGNGIQGLPALEVYGSDGCGHNNSDGALDLAGAVVYGVGCHAGLTVPGNCTTDAEHSLDLPQTLLARGVTAYIANTGYGWGLLAGIGLSERLVEIFTEEMTQGDTVVVGELLTGTKRHYFLETPAFDAYDLKSSMQWCLYGFPMYTVRTSVTQQAKPSLLDPLPSAPRPAIEHFGPVTVERSSRDLTPYLTQLALRFDFTAAEVYQKHSASGDLPNDDGDPPDDDDDPSCPEPEPGEPEGCYYTLNGLLERATGEANLPLEPYFVYDSRLSGTSQHGVLWKGARYDEETGWLPVIGELMSNGGDLSDHGPLPRMIYREPRGARRRILSDESECRGRDLELNSVILATGEVVKEEESDPQYTIHRLHREVDLEVFYYNNTLDGDFNCDRNGPTFGDGPYHSVSGRTIHWTVPASDASGVWRVVVVYDDAAESRWVPVELTEADDGTWTGSDWVDDVERLTYFLQAVDRRGNVTWLEYEPPNPPASGISPEIPLPLEAFLTLDDADLEISMTAAPNPVLAGNPLKLTISVTNLSTNPAEVVAVSIVLPAGITNGLAAGTGWNCDEADNTVTCTRNTLDAGPAPEIQLYLTAPEVGGMLRLEASVSAANDPNPDNDAATVDVWVIDDTMTDLAVFKEDGGVPIVPGQPINYSITVTNNGPNPVYGATVTDVFPTDLHTITWTCEWTVGSLCTASGDGNIDDTVDLLPQGTLLYKATAVVDEEATGPIENTATVDVPAVMTDFALGNNISTVRTGEVIFADGFESGDLSRWSAVVKVK
ncbi:MAG: DUF11 domain-containing protein [bacterium]|nr:DUF11 domain-containing protein [bacterium]